MEISNEFFISAADAPKTLTLTLPNMTKIPETLNISPVLGVNETHDLIAETAVFKNLVFLPINADNSTTRDNSTITLTTIESFVEVLNNTNLPMGFNFSTPNNQTKIANYTNISQNSLFELVNNLDPMSDQPGTTENPIINITNLSELNNENKTIYPIEDEMIKLMGLNPEVQLSTTTKPNNESVGINNTAKFLIEKTIPEPIYPGNLTTIVVSTTPIPKTAWFWKTNVEKDTGITNETETTTKLSNTTESTLTTPSTLASIKLLESDKLLLPVIPLDQKVEKITIPFTTTLMPTTTKITIRRFP